MFLIMTPPYCLKRIGNAKRLWQGQKPRTAPHYSINRSQWKYGREKQDTENICEKICENICEKKDIREKFIVRY